MAYQTPITIKDAISKIQKKKFVLPSIQREFVWNAEQIEQLFDSLMRDYPISTFLFWKVEKERIKDFQFYEFLKNYHERDSRHNNKADLSSEEDVIAILDGQQRLTSMYIALRGSYAKKLPYFRWDNSQAFPKRKLYLNLLRPSDELEMEYDFQFLSFEEAAPQLGFWWFEVGKILDFDDVSKLVLFLSEHGLTDSSKFTSEERGFALVTLMKLFNVIHNNGTLSYFQEEGEALDKVLQIFIRINSGGTKLSYSDLLLSIATAQWKEKDAREEIHRFVDEINKIGDGFSFNKDFVLKSCLVLGDFPDVKFKVDNFKKENMLQIEHLWELISQSISIAVKLIARFGFNRDNLTSSNAIIPIAYFIIKNNFNEGLITSGAFIEERKKIKEWLLRVLLKKTFGGTPDSLYPALRNIINDNPGTFPLDQIIDRYKGTSKSISFGEDDIENLLNIDYSDPLAYSALTLLYPGLNQNYRFHKDHIHPQRLFTINKLAKATIPENQHRAYWDRYNKLPNLQLLQGTENAEKNAKPLIVWLSEAFSNQHDRNVYLQQNLFPSDVSFEFYDFLKFFESRKELLKDRLALQLGVNLKNSGA